jgi:tRNA1(Val) A37 N6-methylase TrmN6
LNWAVTEDLTCDDFLGGKIKVLQPRRGYRAGVDPVLLAASIDARPGQTALELGCGVGVASLCLATRVPGVKVTGVELQPAYAGLAQRNAEANKVDFTVVTADLRHLPPAIRQQRFDHVLMNPPYYDRASGTNAEDEGRDIALGGDTPLAEWLEIGARRLAPKGYLTLILRMARLPEVLDGLKGRLGSVVVLPISGRDGRAPDLFLLRARQEGRAAFRMLHPLTMHVGKKHAGDQESYTPLVTEILRNGAKLPMET